MTFRIESAIAPSVSAAVVSSASSLMRGVSVFEGLLALALVFVFFSQWGGKGGSRGAFSPLCILYEYCMINRCSCPITNEVLSPVDFVSSITEKEYIKMAQCDVTLHPKWRNVMLPFTQNGAM